MVNSTAQGASGSRSSWISNAERSVSSPGRRTRAIAPISTLSGLPSRPTFLTTARFWQEGDANPWELVEMDGGRGLHAEQEYIFHGSPPRAGTRLVRQSGITDIYQKQGRRGGTLASAAWTARNGPIWNWPAPGRPAPSPAPSPSGHGPSSSCPAAREPPRP